MLRLSTVRFFIVIASFMLVLKLIDLAEGTQNYSHFLLKDTIAQTEDNSDTDGGDNPNSEDNVTEEIVSVEQIKKLSDVEIDILQRLSARKQKLLEWEEDLKIKESVLEITEEKIDKKLEELRMLKKAVEKALSEYRREENAKTKSLVKIYENMKPKSAAEILEKMKIADVLIIMGRMKEKNAAEVMAKMNPKIAKEITTRLTDIGRLDNR